MNSSSRLQRMTCEARRSRRTRAASRGAQARAGRRWVRKGLRPRCGRGAAGRPQRSQGGVGGWGAGAGREPRAGALEPRGGWGRRGRAWPRSLGLPTRAPNWRASRRPWAGARAAHQPPRVGDPHPRLHDPHLRPCAPAQIPRRPSRSNRRLLQPPWRPCRGGGLWAKPGLLRRVGVKTAWFWRACAAVDARCVLFGGWGGQPHPLAPRGRPSTRRGPHQCGHSRLSRIAIALQ